jgi:hypothetical protein
MSYIHESCTILTSVYWKQRIDQNYYQFVTKPVTGYIRDENLLKTFMKKFKNVKLYAVTTRRARNR